MTEQVTCSSSSNQPYSVNLNISLSLNKSLRDFIFNLKDFQSFNFSTNSSYSLTFSSTDSTTILIESLVGSKISSSLINLPKYATLLKNVGVII